VVAEGLVQVPLTTTAGLAINPDDGRLDYLGDAMYMPPAGSSPPSIEIMVEIGDGMIHEKEISLPRSYSERFSTWMPQFNSLAGDFNRLKQFAIVHQLSNAVLYHSGKYGEPPQSWDELLASEYSPIDHSSINPLTGDVFHGDGRANDILYEYLGDGFVTLLPVNESGETPWRFTY